MKSEIDELKSKIEGIKTDVKHKNLTSEILSGQVQGGMIIFRRPRNASTPGHSFNLKEQFFDKEKMLISHLQEVLDSAEEDCDAPFTARVNFGTIILPAMMGCEYKVFENAYPWITKHLTKEEVLDFDINSIYRTEIFVRCIEYMKFYQENLPSNVHQYLPDTQGIFDLAHLVYGDELFYEMYDDVEFVERLMRVCLQVYVVVTNEFKKVIRESKTECFHGHALARGIKMTNGGIRISEDSATLISKEHIERFVLPYIQKALDEFGGGFIHYCGENANLLKGICSLKGVNAINFGNPEKQDFVATMKILDENKIALFGHMPKRLNENLNDYIKRMKYIEDGTKRNIILHLTIGEFENTPNEILDLWEKL